MSGSLRRGLTHQAASLYREQAHVLRTLSCGIPSASTHDFSVTSISVHPKLNAACTYTPRRPVSTSYPTCASHIQWSRKLDLTSNWKSSSYQSLFIDTHGSVASALSQNGSYLQRRFKGHSKWQNIQKRKETQDRKKSNLRGQLNTKLRIAIKLGGGNDPKINTMLASVIELAKKNSMPKAAIDNALTRAVERVKNYSDYTIAFSGPHGTSFIILAIGPNTNVVTTDVKKHMKKYNFIPQNLNQVEHMFEYKGEITVAKPSGDLDEIAINCDAEEYTEEKTEDKKDVVKFICEGNELMKMKKNLEDHGLKILEFDTRYIPLQPLDLTDEQLEDINQCTEKIEEFENLLSYYVNL